MVANQLYELCEAAGPEPTRLVLSFFGCSILGLFIPVMGTQTYVAQVVMYI
jgi:hypothetical protein